VFFDVGEEEIAIEFGYAGFVVGATEEDGGGCLLGGFVVGGGIGFDYGLYSKI
jgi:hypothetical protein